MALAGGRSQNGKPRNRGYRGYPKCLGFRAAVDMGLVIGGEVGPVGL